MSRAADSAIRPDAVVRLAPGIELLTGKSSRHFVVRYGATACGEVELPAGEQDLGNFLALLAQRRWTPLSGLGGAEELGSKAALLETLVDQEWLHVARGEAELMRRKTADDTLANVITDLAAAAATSLDVAETAAFTNALLDICEPWKQRSVGEPPPWSGLTLDLTPFEFSANFDESGAQLRAVAEPQSVNPSAASYWRSAMSVARILEANWQADVHRLRTVEDLFEPADSRVPLAAFYGVESGGGTAPPRFKIYLSPSAASQGAESACLARACERFGLGASWRDISDAASGEPRHWTLACLDLSSGPDARLKIYETLADSERAGPTRLAGTAIEDLAAVLTAALPPNVRGFRWGMLSYTLMPTGELRHTFGVAVRPGARQGVVRQAVESVFARLGIDSRPYTNFFRALAAACDEPVEHSYVTVQRAAGLPRITAYLAPRIYHSRFGSFERAVWPSPIASFARSNGR